METCSLIHFARLLLTVLLTVVKPLYAGSYTANTNTDRDATTEYYFLNNVTNFRESTVSPTELGSPTTAPSADTERGDSASNETSDSLSRFSEEKNTLTEVSSDTEFHGQTAFSVDTESWKSPAQTDSTYISSTNSRAGERTLLSLNPNSTSPHTENSSSSQGSEPRGSTGGGGPTDRLVSSGHSQSDASPDSQRFSDNTSLGGSELHYTDVTRHSLGGVPDGTLNSMLPQGVTLKGMEDPEATELGRMSPGKGTHENGTSVSSGYPLRSSEDDITNTSQRGRDSLATSTRSFDTQASNKPEGAQPLTQESDIKQILTTAPPMVHKVTTAVDESQTKLLSSPKTLSPETEQPALITEVVSTTPGTMSQTTQFAVESSTSTYLSTTRFSEPRTTTITQTQRTPPSTTQMIMGPQITPSASQHLSPSRAGEAHTRSSSVTSIVSTNVPPAETSTTTPGKTTASSGLTASSYGNTAPSSTATETTLGILTHPVTAQLPKTTTKMHSQSTMAPGAVCEPNPCVNGGICLTQGKMGHRCECLSTWTGRDCSEDVDECLGSPCPSGSSCVNTRGSFSCECPLGYSLENGRTCTRAKTFLGTFRVLSPPLNSTHTIGHRWHEIQREVIQLLNASLSNLRGYHRSTLNRSDVDRAHVSVMSMFSMTTNVTSANVFDSVQTFLKNCSWTTSSCGLVLHHTFFYRAESLCLAQGMQCDTERSECTDADGTSLCRCRAGYFKHSADDLSCRECDDGFKLVNGTCVQCAFGFGGFNCGNFYKLITVVVSPAGGVLILIMVIALIVTCCRKDKNDINKIIFKSGDFQMSPYVGYPKSNRVSMEWGRESIEMQENGSTKNLLQMTDIYYSPTLRNPELERSGLYPFSGLPGSRHSCIYPAQWNPSFISDDTRRRDYF